MSQKSVFILGAGLIGRPMAFDLIHQSEFDVGIADLNPQALLPFEGSEITTYCLDLAEPEIWLAVASNYDYMINAVPGFMGYATLKALITLGKPIVDIAFYPEDPLELNHLAKNHGSCVVCDMGVAPGMSHLLSGAIASKLENIDKLMIYVGGLPVERNLPWQYKAVFSPNDVIEEYTRPARLIENGNIVFKEALSDAEMIHFDKIGTLEAFNSDGLRSLVYTLKANQMAEKTLRYPGHVDLIKTLKESGFFAEKPITVNGSTFQPLDFTKAILFAQWKLEPAEADLTVMRIQADGSSGDGTAFRITYDLFDKPDPTLGVHSMARVTGYAATSALRMLNQQMLVEPGIHMPEMIGKDETIVQFMLNDQKKKGIVYTSLTEKI
jgi:saccharopine dehydrogenase-like NADP-dependent oxidoreductase